MPLPSIPRGFLALCCAPLALCAAAQVPDAGPDRSVSFPGPAPLSGTVAGRSPLVWWTADGNGASENMAIHYAESSGQVAVGPLRNAAGDVFGFPGDLVRVQGEVLGVDVGRRQLYRLDIATGLCTEIGPPFPSTWASVHSLAYDAAGDRLFAVDASRKQLLRIDRTTGAVTAVGSGTLASWYQLRALAYHAGSGLLYGFDEYSDSLLAIHPASGQASLVRTLTHGSSSRIDEIQFFGSELYLCRALYAGSVLDEAQLERLDIGSGAITPIGPRLTQVSAHALLVESVPERTEWVLVSGTGDVTFDDPGALDTAVTFSAPGVHAIHLRVYSPDGLVSAFDEVVIDVFPPDCNHNGVDDALDIAQGISLDRNHNGVPDECECHPGPQAYCTAKTNSQGGRASLGWTGSPSASGAGFEVVVSGALKHKPAVLFHAAGRAAQPFQGGWLCVQPPVRRTAVRLLDAFGQGSWPVGIGPEVVGTTRCYQVWHRDAAHPDGTGVALSDALEVVFCQ